MNVVINASHWLAV